mgnify:CR=1 FL=1
MKRTAKELIEKLPQYTCFKLLNLQGYESFNYSICLHAFQCGGNGAGPEDNGKCSGSG